MSSPFRQMTHVVITGFFATAMLLVIGCGDQAPKQEEAPVVEATASEEQEPQTAEYPIPSPLEVTEMLNNAGASYILDIANSPELVDGYLSEQAKALNLGVYGSDLSYSVTYNKTQQAMDFFECTKKLRDALDIQTPFDEGLSEQMEQNLDNKDSLYVILNGSFENTFEFLNAHEKSASSALILAAGWVEGMYLATELAAFTKENSEIYQVVAKQGNSLISLNQYLELNGNDEHVHKLLNALKNISTLYEGIEEVDGVYTITQEQFTKLQTAVKALRKEIVETA